MNAAMLKPAPIPPQWLLAEVAGGLQRLVALSLPGQPPAETIALTAAAWAEALMELNIAWDAAADAPRLQAAFRQLAVQIERWPAPAQLIRALPSRPAPPALAWPKAPPERVAAALRELKRLFDSGAPPGPRRPGAKR